MESVSIALGPEKKVNRGHMRVSNGSSARHASSVKKGVVCGNFPQVLEPSKSVGGLVRTPPEMQTNDD
jgi:hypothetical protein